MREAIEGTGATFHDEVTAMPEMYEGRTPDMCLEGNTWLGWRCGEAIFISFYYYYFFFAWKLYMPRNCRILE